MKTFKNGKLYVQLKDIWFIKDYVSIPQRIWKKVFENDIVITDREMDNIVSFEEIEDILFFENQDSIIDLDILNGKTIEQIDNMIEDINKEISDIENKFKYISNTLNSSLKGIKMRAYKDYKSYKTQLDLLEYKKEAIEKYKETHRKEKVKTKNQF